MYRKDFVKKTVSSLKPARLERLRDILDSEHYIPFDFVEHDKIDESILEEKIGDYFEKVELLAGGKRFEYIIEQYANDLDSVVRDHIDSGSHANKGSASAVPRARKYYYRASALKRDGLKTFESLLDYSRIMLCLYMAIIKQNHKSISNFEYPSENLNGKEILKAMREEKDSSIFGEKKKFNTHSPYSMDRCTFIVVIIMYQYIKSNEVEVED
jgi:hypothetical protein